MKIERNYSLKSSNTFSIEVLADYYIELFSEKAIQDFIRNDLKEFNRSLLLGGGSNVLFLNDFKGIVIAIRNEGITIQDKGSDVVWVTAQAGESWLNLVDHCTDNGLTGLQNLALIPGNAGSAPIQNIGAYGSELKDVFHHLDGYFLDTGEKASFTNADCQFGYRDSIFKRELKDRFCISSITLELKRNQKPDITYRALKEEVATLGLSEPSASEIRDIVKNIRRSKLPDPAIIGNAGSFFKNPVISAESFKKISEEYPDIVSFSQPDGTVKLAAGWLIEKCGWKGKRKGEAGVHEKQALVLVNYGNAKGQEILELANEIVQSIKDRFKVDLQTEVNLIH